MYKVCEETDRKRSEHQNPVREFFVSLEEPNQPQLAGILICVSDDMR